jgi:hypothetical protein
MCGSIFRGLGVGLSDLCEDCHPVEVAEHFPVMILVPP